MPRRTTTGPLFRVVAEISGPRPDRDCLAAICGPCLFLRGARLLGGYAALDGEHHLLVFEAPDAEAVRQVLQRQACLPVGVRVWTACEWADPDDVSEPADTTAPSTAPHT